MGRVNSTVKQFAQIGKTLKPRLELLKKGFVPLVLIAFVKIVLALLIYSVPGKVAEPWNRYQQGTTFNWYYLFSAWDSGYYLSIAANWYPSHFASIWAFFPLYPSIIRLLSSVGVNYLLSGAIVANAAGLASVLVFHRMAERYLGRANARFSTIVYFLLPPVFVFTTVSYSESLFLLLSLLAWYAHLHEHDLASTALTGLVTLTKNYGLLIMIAIAFVSLRKHKYRRASLLAVPVLVLASWFLYAYNQTGVLFAPLAAELNWNSTTVIQIRNNIFLFLAAGDAQSLRFLLRYWAVILIGTVFFSFFLILTYRAWRLNSSLGIYSTLFLTSFSIATILFLPTFASMPRYLSVAFSSGIALHTTKRILFLLAVFLFITMDFFAWWLFLFSPIFH